MAQDNQHMSPATPLEFVRRYAAFTEDLDAAAINTLVSKQMTLVWGNDKPQTTYTRSQQLAALTKIYDAEKAAGTKIRPADYTITEHSDNFAIVKFTWEIEKPKEDRVSYARTSYVIRREPDGWRLVFVMELGSGLGGVQEAEFS